MSFCTVVNCMDGRIQIPVINFLKEKFQVEYVDSVTEAGPNKILAEFNNSKLIDSIYNRIKISIENHNSNSLAVVGHHDCAGNPTTKENQIDHIKKSMDNLSKSFP